LHSAYNIQCLTRQIAFGTKAFKLNYEADFLNAIKNWNFYQEARYHGPGYAFNFGGLGNNSTRPVMVRTFIGCGKK
jgi:hypothetical protein